MSSMHEVEVEGRGAYDAWLDEQEELRHERERESALLRQRLGRGRTGEALKQRLAAALRERGLS